MFKATCYYGIGFHFAPIVVVYNYGHIFIITRQKKYFTLVYYRSKKYASVFPIESRIFRIFKIPAIDPLVYSHNSGHTL